jgi:hypothetical protein
MEGILDKVFVQNETWIPVGLILYAEKENLIEELKFYIGLKLTCSGKIPAHKAPFKTLMAYLGCKSRTTFYKRIRALKKLNWVGFNPASDTYYIRGYKRVCEDLKIPYHVSVEFCITCFKEFRAYMFASIVGQRVKAMEYAKKRSKKKVKFVPQYWNIGTFPDLPSNLLNLGYNGLPNSAMAKLTGKSISRCSELKNLAEKAGFLHTKEKLVTVDIMPRSPNIMEILRDWYPDKYGRFKIKAIKKGKDKGKLKILEQMMDEITPLLRYRKRKV